MKLYTLLFEATMKDTLTDFMEQIEEAINQQEFATAYEGTELTIDGAMAYITIKFADELQFYIDMEAFQGFIKMQRFSGVVGEDLIPSSPIKSERPLINNIPFWVGEVLAFISRQLEEVLPMKKSVPLKTIDDIRKNLILPLIPSLGILPIFQDNNTNFSIRSNRENFVIFVNTKTSEATLFVGENKMTLSSFDYNIEEFVAAIIKRFT